MKETRLREILNQAVYEAVIGKYREFIRKGEKEKALGLKKIVYANLNPMLSEDGRNPWRQPNDFLYELCGLNSVFDMYFKATKQRDYHLFGINLNDLKIKIV